MHSLKLSTMHRKRHASALSVLLLGLQLTQLLTWLQLDAVHAAWWAVEGSLVKSVLQDRLYSNMPITHGHIRIAL